MTTEQPLALKLADDLEIIYGSLNTPHECAAALRRQHAEIEALRECSKENAVLRGLLKEARKVIRASTSRNLAKDWDQRATDALAQGEKT